MAHGLNSMIKREIECNNNKILTIESSVNTKQNNKMSGNGKIKTITTNIVTSQSQIQTTIPTTVTTTTTTGAKMGSRRIFTPQFKLQVLDSYRNDNDCKGNQRATARKYGIHRRQIQKWLQCEGNLRSSVINNINRNSTTTNININNNNNNNKISTPLLLVQSQQQQKQQQNLSLDLTRQNSVVTLNNNNNNNNNLITTNAIASTLNKLSTIQTPITTISIIPPIQQSTIITTNTNVTMSTSSSSLSSLKTGITTATTTITTPTANFLSPILSTYINEPISISFTHLENVSSASLPNSILSSSSINTIQPTILNTNTNNNNNNNCKDFSSSSSSSSFDYCNDYKNLNINNNNYKQQKYTIYNYVDNNNEHYNNKSNDEYYKNNNEHFNNNNNEINPIDLSLHNKSIIIDTINQPTTGRITTTNNQRIQRQSSPILTANQVVLNNSTNNKLENMKSTKMEAWDLSCRKRKLINNSIDDDDHNDDHNNNENNTPTPPKVVKLFKPYLLEDNYEKKIKNELHDPIIWNKHNNIQQSPVYDNNYLYTYQIYHPLMTSSLSSSSSTYDLPYWYNKSQESPVSGYDSAASVCSNYSNYSDVSSEYLHQQHQLNHQQQQQQHLQQFNYHNHYNQLNLNNHQDQIQQNNQEQSQSYQQNQLTNNKQRQSYSIDFKLQTIDSYYHDITCQGNQRAVASKYNIHRRQVQKWLQQEDDLRQRTIIMN